MLSVLIMFTQSSIFSLLAVERYVAIFMPFRYQVLMTPRNAVLVILATWLLAVLMGLVPLMGWHKTLADSDDCFFVFVVDMTYMVYFNSFACVLAPLLIMFLIYAQISVAVKRRRGASPRSNVAESCGQNVQRDEGGHVPLPLPLSVHGLLDPASRHQLLPAALSLLSCASRAAARRHHPVTRQLCCQPVPVRVRHESFPGHI